MPVRSRRLPAKAIRLSEKPLHPLVPESSHQPIPPQHLANLVELPRTHRDLELPTHRVSTGSADPPGESGPNTTTFRSRTTRTRGAHRGDLLRRHPLALNLAQASGPWSGLWWGLTLRSSIRPTMRDS